MNKVCVLGSINMDLVIKVKDMPKEGETILSNSFEKVAGGKGANQAIAAKRCGNEVTMISKIGKDENGKTLKDALDSEDINVDFIYEDDVNPTGMAMITVNERGNNSIVVISGSNMTINEIEINKTEEVIKKNDILIAQFETPEEITESVFKVAKEAGKITILNPAPAKEITTDILKYTDVIIPNETEVELLTGIKVENLEDAKKAAKKFINKGIRFVIITLGAQGAALVSKDEAKIIPAYKVKAIDTTAAGDSFIGGLSCKLDVKNLNFENLEKAISFGNKVSSITVQKEGAQPSIATLKEVIEVYGEE